MADVAHNDNFARLHPDHLDSVYNMYVENNSIYDPFLERQILSAERDYSYDDFIDILQDDKTFGFVLNEQIPCQEFSDYVGYYNEDPVFIPVLKGFLVYEIISNPLHYSILFLEAENKNVENFGKLLGHLKTRMKETKKICPIEIEIFDEDSSYYKMGLLQQNGFKEKKLVNASKGPDIFIFEYKVESSEKPENSS